MLPPTYSSTNRRSSIGSSNRSPNFVRNLVISIRFIRSDFTICLFSCLGPFSPQLEAVSCSLPPLWRNLSQPTAKLYGLSAERLNGPQKRLSVVGSAAQAASDKTQVGSRWRLKDESLTLLFPL